MSATAILGPRGLWSWTFSRAHDRDHYLNLLQETRAKSLAEFSKRDDAWLVLSMKTGPRSDRQLLQVVLSLVASAKIDLPRHHVRMQTVLSRTLLLE